MSRNKQLLIVLAIFSYVVYVVFTTVDQHDNNFGDFQVYFNAANADNPYDAHEIDAKGLNYQYLPLTRYVFQVFTTIDYQLALFIYVLLNIITIVLLVRLWSRFYNIGADPWFYMFMVLAVNASFYLAFRTGNIVIINAVLIWLAISQLIQRRIIWFCVFIAIAAGFKITPILFLPLAFLLEKQLALKPVLYTTIAFAGFVMINAFIEPELTRHFFESGHALLNEPGIFNPNGYSFSQEIANFGLSKLGVENGTAAGILIYVLLVSGFCIYTVKWWKGSGDKSVLEIISVVVVLYGLLLPRFKDYDYVLILPALYFMIRRIKVQSFHLFFLLAILSASYVVLPGYRYAMYVLWAYYPYIISAGIYVLFVRKSSAKIDHSTL